MTSGPAREVEHPDASMAGHRPPTTFVDSFWAPPVPGVENLHRPVGHASKRALSNEPLPCASALFSRRLSAHFPRRCRLSARRRRSEIAAAPFAPASAPMRAVSVLRHASSPAWRGIARDMWMYCDPDNHDLKVAVAAHLGVGAENVVVGEGIDGLLSLVARMYVEPGDAVVTSLGAYPTFNFHVAGFGGRLVAVPYENDRESLDGLLAAVPQGQCAAGLSVQPRQSDGKLVGGGRTQPLHRSLAGNHHAGARRGLWRDGAGLRAAADRCLAGRTSSACAPSRRPTDWPAYAAAMRSAKPR